MTVANASFLVIVVEGYRFDPEFLDGKIEKLFEFVEHKIQELGENIPFPSYL